MESHPLDDKSLHCRGVDNPLKRIMESSVHINSNCVPGNNARNGIYHHTSPVRFLIAFDRFDRSYNRLAIIRATLLAALLCNHHCPLCGEKLEGDFNRIVALNPAWPRECKGISHRISYLKTSALASKICRACWIESGSLCTGSAVCLLIFSFVFLRDFTSLVPSIIPSPAEGCVTAPL